MSTQQMTPWVPADTLAARLILVRHHLGLTQREAAEQAGVGFGSWQSWESGRAPRDAITKLTQVAEKLGIKRDWLLFGGPLEGPLGGPGGNAYQPSTGGYFSGRFRKITGSDRTRGVNTSPVRHLSPVAA